jgi:hypothetical protein
MVDKIAKSLTVLFILTVTAGYALAQNGVSHARSVAMGGAYTAVARGVEAPNWNPANLGLSGERVYRLNLVSFGVGFRNNSFSKRHYDLYNGAYLSETDKQDILASIPEDGLQADVDTEVQAIGISFGRFAITAAGFGVTDFTLSKDLVDLALNGNDLDRTYSINATAGEGWGASSVALSLGLPIAMPGFHEFAIGVSAKYLRGWVYGNIIEATSDVLTDIDGLHADGQLVLDKSLGGSGFGLDLGAAASLTRTWSLGVSVGNVTSNINWNKDNKRHTYTFRADSVSVEKIDSSDIDSVFIHSDSEEDIAAFSTSLPTVLRVGIARNGRMFSIAADMVQGLKTGPGIATKPRFSVGAELRLIPILPLRAGFATGGDRGFSPAAGFALDFGLFSWDFAVASREGISDSKGIQLAFNWMFRL